MKKILFAASECVPFIKTGGLADVCGALPKGFNKDEWDVRVVIPNYTCIPDEFRNNFKYITHFYMGTGSYNPGAHVGVMTYEYEGVTFYFIDNLVYFGGSRPYGDFRTDIEKFAFFDKAVLSILPIVGFRPDLIHCHDWQTGLIPVYLKTEFAAGEFYRGIKSVMTIHNLRFQGIWDVETMQGLTGLPDYVFTPDKLEYKRDANMLKGGLVYADYITTVSETYAQEIQTPQYGEGLDGLLSARHMDLRGIVNGIDYDIWNPETDGKINTNYNIKDVHKGKAANKRALQERTASHGADDSLVFFIHFRDISFSAHGQPIWIHGFGRALDPCFKYILADTAFSMNFFVIKKYNLRKQYRLFVPRFTLSALMHMQQRNIAHLCKPFLSKSKGYCHKRIISTGRSYRI